MTLARLWRERVRSAVTRFAGEGGVDTATPIAPAMGGRKSKPDRSFPSS